MVLSLYLQLTRSNVRLLTWSRESLFPAANTNNWSFPHWPTEAFTATFWQREKVEWGSKNERNIGTLLAESSAYCAQCYKNERKKNAARQVLCLFLLSVSIWSDLLLPCVCSSQGVFVIGDHWSSSMANYRNKLQKNLFPLSHQKNNLIQSVQSLSPFLVSI